MKTSCLISFILILTAMAPVGKTAVITVNTANNVDPLPAETSLLWAMQMLQDGDTIAFNIPGAGPHYLLTPTNGYPIITKNNVTIDGYTQPGAVPNTNPILAANNAQIKIVLDSRALITPETYTNYTSMAYEPANSLAGFGDTEFAVLGIFGGTNVHIRGLCLLGSHGAGLSQYGIAIARDFNVTAESAHISGCWIGVDVDGTSGHGFDSSIAAFRHRGSTSAERPGSNRHIIGVAPGSANPRAEFNVIIGGTINVIMEGQGFRISGNFLGVLPSGVDDYIPPFAKLGQIAESHLELGRGASDLVIGTDGDGVNDADERNVMGGVVTSGHSSQAGALNLGGYRHVIEFYSLSSSPGPERTRNRIAGNYIGVGVDGVTRFTNGVPAWNGSAINGSVCWMGSDFDGVSDAIEANVINNNYPANLFYPTASGFNNAPSLGFFDEPNNGALYSVRGNKLINNYPYPVNPARDGGSFILSYVNKALETPGATYADLLPRLSGSSSTARIIGTVPVANATYPWTIIDLYLPDPEGLVNGLAVPDAGLPYGWVQGSNYLGSFVLGSGADHDSSPEGFAFDICSLGLAPNTTVVISANYSQDPPGTHNARVLTSLFSAPQELFDRIAITSITKAGPNVTIRWCGGTGPYQLQKKTNLSDTMWTDVGAPTSGFTATDAAGGVSGFYQVKGN